MTEVGGPLLSIPALLSPLVSCEAGLVIEKSQEVWAGTLFWGQICLPILKCLPSFSFPGHSGLQPAGNAPQSPFRDTLAFPRAGGGVTDRRQKPWETLGLTSGRAVYTEAPAPHLVTGRP